MSLPERVQIGPLAYAVTEDQAAHDRASVEGGQSTWGRIEYGRERILLDPDQSLGHKRLALLHETLHGCWHLTDRKHDDDEAACLALSAPLLDVLRRNPTLVAYLLAED